MERPDLDLIENSIQFVTERVAKGTVIHLVEYIRYLESKEKEPPHDREA